VKEEPDIEAELKRGVFADGAGDHVDDGAIAAMIESGALLGERERAHLASCFECREIVGQLLRERGKVVALPSRGRWVAGLAIAASIALVSIVVVLPEEKEHRGTKGIATQMSRGIALVAVDREGARRDLSEGGKVRTSERLGFIAGHPEEGASTLSILGWDGEKVHWYFPEKAGAAPYAIEGKKIGVRLPFEIELSDHATGELLVVAGFDVDPNLLARQLETGTLSNDLSVFRLKLEAE
jgi:hypothetical protein